MIPMRKLVLIILSTAALLLSGCLGGSRVGEVEKTGHVVISVDFNSLNEDVAYIDLEITRRAASHTGVLTKDNPKITFVDLPVGMWTVTSFAKTEDGEMLYHNAITLAVVDDFTQNRTLQLDVFDGRFGDLDLLLERIPSTQSSPERSKGTGTAVVQITGGGFSHVYSAIKKIDIDSAAGTAVLNIRLPAEKHYQITVLMTGDNNEFLGVGRLDGLFLLSETPTSATVPIYEPEHTVVFPDKLHGGDSTLQIKTTVPEPRSQLMFAYVWIGLNPWRKNGVRGLWSTNTGSEGWIVNAIEGTLPEVTKPTKLYYQIGVAPKRYLLHSTENWPYHYVPNIERGEKLPYIWIYPGEAS